MLYVKDISKTFDKGLPTENVLFEKFNLNIEKGEFISVVGSNGSGKTTLLNIIAGNIPSDSGSLEFDGADVTKTAEYKRASRIARVFQDPKMGTCATMTVAENLTMALNKGKKYGLKWGLKKTYKKDFAKMLGTLNMNIEDKVDVLCGQLSGGQRQALALLMSTITKPELLLLDEHTAALDPRTSENIMQLTQEVIEERNITALMVTHNLEYAIRFGTRLIMLHEGQILLDIKGEHKKNLTIAELVDLFKNAQGGVLTDEMVFS